MSFYEEMKTVIENCGTADSATRKNGESEMKRMRDEDPRKFLISLVNELGKADNPTAVRQMAAIVLKNFIANKQSNNKYQDFWIKIDPKERNEIKEMVLQSMQSPEWTVRQQLAALIAAVAVIEVPRKEWDSLVPTLCSTIQNEASEEGLKRALLLTIGYICEDLQPEDISLEVKNQVVQTLVMNIFMEAEKIEMTKLAVRAFYHSIPYANACFKQQTDRDFIMDKLVKVCALTDEGIQENALQCLSQIASQEYEHLDPYLMAIMNVTQVATQGDNLKVGAQAFEFWIQLTEHECTLKSKQAPCKEIIQQQKEYILALIFQGLSKVELDDDEYEWGTALAAACCLQGVSQILKDEIIQPVIQYVASCFQQQDDATRKYSGLVALGSIFEGPSRGKLAEILVQAMPQLGSLGHHELPKIRETVAWVLGRICEHHHEVVTNNDIGSMIKICVDGLADVPKVAAMYCRALNHLAESLQPTNENEESNALTPYYQGILEALFTAANRADQEDAGVDLMQNAYVAFTSFVQHSCLVSRETNYNLLMTLVTKLTETVSQEDPSDHILSLQDNLCGIIQAILVKVGLMVQKPMADNIILLIIQLFKQANTVTENGLTIMNGLVNGCSEVLDIMQMCQYLKHALEIKEKICTRMACGIISDLAYGKPDQIKLYLDDYIPCILELLRDNKIDREIKIHAIRALADLALNCGDSFKREFLQLSIEVINHAAKGSVELTAKAYDEATASFLQELREEVLKSYQNFIMAAEDGGALDLFVPHLSTIYEFIQRLVEIIGYNEIHLLQSVVALVGDIVERFGDNPVVKAQSTQRHIEQSIYCLQRQKDQECTQQAQLTLNLINQILKP